MLSGLNNLEHFRKMKVGKFMNKQMNYGKYAFPPTLEKLIELNSKLEKEGYSLDDSLSLILEDDRIGYDVTPCDVITFARLGVDGIHFGLLTDFGVVSDLEEAFVVCISPMNFGEHIKIVARNLKEFVGLICTLKDACAVANLQLCKDEDDYKELLQEITQLEEEEVHTSRNSAIFQMMSTIKCELINDVYDYVEREVIAARKEQIVLQTMDEIGIVPLQHINSKHTIFELESDIDFELNDVKDFFHQSTVESKLAFIRDAQFAFLLADDQELMNLVIHELRQIGLTDEVNRIENPY